MSWPVALGLAVMLFLGPSVASARQTPPGETKRPVSTSARQPEPAEPERPSVAAVRSTSAIDIDGRLDEPGWAAARPATSFIQRDPDEGKPATFRTEVRVLYDEHAVYFGARMFDPEPAKIARRVTRRDGDAENLADLIYIAVDPRHDHLTGSIFGVTAAGSQLDAALFNDSSDDGSWDAVWQSAVSIDDEGWIAEVRVPFSQLRFTAAAQQTWGLHLVRYVQRLNEETWWAHIPKTESGKASKMGHLTGLDGIATPRHLELLPYATLKGEFAGNPDPGNPFADGRRAIRGLGLDAKWGLTSSLTLDATVNPDFGQVEVDPAVVNLTAFETFYDEKRPFFIEGANIFDNFGRAGATSYAGFNRSNPTLLYSRRIGRAPQGSATGEYVSRPEASTIVGAAKLTGKTAAGWNIGLLNAVTAREFADTASGTLRSRAEVEPLTNYFAARIRRDLGQRAGVGMIATAVNRNVRDPGLAAYLPQQAYLFGGDGHVFFDRKREWVVTSGLSGSYVSGSEAAMLRLQRSSTRYYQRPDAPHLEVAPSATSLSGWNFQLDLNRNAGNFQPNASVWVVSPGYEVNDLGFQSSADRYGTHVMTSWRKTTPDQVTRYRQVLVSKFWIWNFDRDLLGDGVYASAWATLPNYWSGSAVFVVTRTVNSDRLTRGGPSMRSPGGVQVSADVETDERKMVVFSLGGSYSSSFEGGKDGTAELSLDIKPAPAVSFSVGPTFTRSRATAQYVRTVADPAAQSTFGARYVFGDLDQTEVAMSVRANVLFSPRMSLQLYAQPLLSVGRYFDLKEAARPRTYDFLVYGRDTGAISLDPGTGRYHIDPGGGGQPFSVGNPDFNFKSLRVNTVFRWEFRPGSTVYLVWTEMREDAVRPGRFAFSRDVGSLFGAPGDNVLMAKISYWFGK